MANNEQPCVHQLRAELVLEKRTKEKFFMTTSVALPFAHAFSASAVCVPITIPTPRTLVQAVLTSTAGGPLTILDYALKGPISILHDPNTHHIKGTIVHPNQRTSVVFCITTPDRTSRDVTLDITFTLPSPVPPFSCADSSNTLTQSSSVIPTTTLHSFSTVLTLALPSPQYIIETRNPPTAYLAQPIQFELLITHVHTNDTTSSDTSTAVVVLFEIEEDPLWVISGKRRASIQLVGAAASVVCCRLRPISAGILPVPKVRLCGVPASSFIVSPKGPPHVEVFPEPITSECTPTTADASSM